MTCSISAKSFITSFKLLVSDIGSPIKTNLNAPSPAANKIPITINIAEAAIPKPKFLKACLVVITSNASTNPSNVTLSLSISPFGLAITTNLISKNPVNSKTPVTIIKAAAATPNPNVANASFVVITSKAVIKHTNVSTSFSTSFLGLAIVISLINTIPPTKNTPISKINKEATVAKPNVINASLVPITVIASKNVANVALSLRISF